VDTTSGHWQSLDAPVMAGTGISVTHTGGVTTVTNSSTTTAGVIPADIHVRLTATCGTPVTNTNVTGATSICVDPYSGGTISLLNSGSWVSYAVSEVTIKLTDSAQSGTLTNGAKTVTGLTTTTHLVRGMQVTGTNVGAAAVISTVDSATQVTLSVNSTGSGSSALTFKVPAGALYDVFCKGTGASTYDCQLGTQWTSGILRAVDTTQANAINGVLVNDTVIESGDSNSIAAQTGRFIGTIRADDTTAGTTDDADTLRYVANYWIRRRRRLYKAVSATHTYNTSTWRAWNNDTANRVSFITCTAEEPIDGVVQNALASGAGYTGVLIDATTGTPDSQTGNITNEDAAGVVSYAPQLGYHFLQVMEFGNGAAGWGNYKIQAELSQ
jgi:hypothetical protein